jgi:3-methyladenine DNA glycosylase AlkD
MNFITTLKQFCEANSNSVYGQKQSDYLKNQFPFYGIPTTKRREILKDALLVHKEEVSTNFRAICWE